jgi:hypothetical protein
VVGTLRPEGDAVGIGGKRDLEVDVALGVRISQLPVIEREREDRNARAAFALLLGLEEPVLAALLVDLEVDEETFSARKRGCTQLQIGFSRPWMVSSRPVALLTARVIGPLSVCSPKATKSASATSSARMMPPVHLRTRIADWIA